MRTAETDDKRVQATRASQALQSVPGVRGILLFGSVARGDATRSSDIDLIVVGSSADLSASLLRRCASSFAGTECLSMSYHSASSLRSYLERWSRFGAHLRLEGKILHDTDGELAQILGAHRPIDTAYEFASQRRSLERYVNPNRFGGRFLVPLSHLYRIGRATAFAATAKAGEFEFTKRRVFALASTYYPQSARDFATIEALAPFYEVVRNPDSSVVPFPFDPVGLEGRDGYMAACDALSRILVIGDRE